jgi:cobalt ECF transporter T component CbiQ/cobalamin biosynthesis protein CbiM
MHIPDGYLAPAVSLALALPTVPVWAIATQKVKKVLNNRTVPLLAIFSALSFTVMMFNIPVPGGTTAHAVGGTLIAVVLGPWAAAIAVSTALILQALFFGDGGVLAIFANCFNMAIVLPFVGYGTYRLLAAGAPVLSTRRAVAAGIGAYAGITVAALAVGIELGIEPALFSQNGHALYSPYGIREAVPAMLLAHALGASIVEGLVTGLGVAYLQRRHPEYLTSLRRVFAPEAATDGEAPRRPLWQVASVAVAAGATVLAMLGLIEGGGNPGRMFGADWAQVDWPSVATMLLMTAVVGAVVVPAVYLLLPRAAKRVGAGFATLAVLAPLGLIAPGLAFGEGKAGDVKNAFGYVPSGLQALSGVFSAPLSGYDVPLPFFSQANGALWHAAVGYELSGVIGMLLVGGAVYAMALLLRPQAPLEPAAEPTDAPATVPTSAPSRAHSVYEPHHTREGRIGWLEQTLGGITENIERAVFTEQHARSDGWLQRRDPRIKMIGALTAILAASLTASIVGLAILYGATLAAARASKVPFGFFVKRVWLGIPLFAGIVVLPAIFFVPGPRLFDLGIGPAHLAPSWNGLAGAALFISRVGVSVSIAILLVVTTPWADVLKSLRALKVPQVFVLVLSMTYRYIFLFLHTANGILLARKSRVVGRTTGGEQRRWITGTMGNLMSRAFKMSNDVYAAMLARGFGGEIRSFTIYRLCPADVAALAGVAAIAVAAVFAGRTLP